MPNPSLRAAALRIALLRPRRHLARHLSSRPSASAPPGPEELKTGELQGVEFRVEALRRTGEDDATKRARLLCRSPPLPTMGHPPPLSAANHGAFPPLSVANHMGHLPFLFCPADGAWLRVTDQSRKRGILESDLILSTFAAAHLPAMTGAQLAAYDLFLDENDWDIYYWATQPEPSPGSSASAPPSTDTADASPPATQGFVATAQGFVRPDPPQGEWAQTVGNVRQAYRPVPSRWRDSPILALLRDHVSRRSANGAEAKGMGFMPPLDNGR